MPTLRRTSPHRTGLSALLALAVLLAAPAGMQALAQQPAAEAPAQTGVPAPTAPVVQSPAVQSPPAVAPSVQTPAPAVQTGAPATAEAADPLVPPLAPAGAAADAGATAPGAADPAPATSAAEGEDASVAAQLPHDLSPWGMFMAADWVVKAVMIGLAFASVVTWTVWLAKSLELMVAKARLRRALRGYLASASLDEARKVGAAGPAGAMLRTTDLELQRSGDLPADGIKERVSISLSRIEVAAGRAITRGTGLLATIGATAPFVGLFGTVWGIMNSFIGISKAQTTNLAVVAPGIAEALLATAIGLVAAIPAVVIYNHFSRQVSGYRVLMGDASAEVRETKTGSVAGITAKKTGRMILDSLEAGGKGSITVAVACAMAGMIAGCITVTGLASKLISGVIAISSAIPNPTLSLLLALFLTMLCCIVLGMGVPTTANYCIMASTCAPILITLGIPKVAAHFFVFYFGIVADITPPVALAAYAGSAIAKSDPMKTGINATKLAIAAFIVPYIFAMNPSMLLMDQGVLAAIQVIITSCLGIFGIAAALEGYIVTRAPWWQRILLAAGGLCLIDPEFMTDVVGVAVIVVVIVLQIVLRKHSKPAAA